jgi:multidrug resistance efflux pump
LLIGGKEYNYIKRLKGFFKIENKFKKSTFFKTGRAVIVIFMAMIIAMLLIKFKPKEKRIESENKGHLVEVISIKPEIVTMNVEAYGTVKAREDMKLVAEVNGRVEYISEFFDEGCFVKKGTLILRIDQREFKINVKMAEANLKQLEAKIENLNQETLNLKENIAIAKNNLEISEKEYSRFQKLARQNIVSKTNMEKTKRVCLKDLSSLKELENQLKLMPARKKMLGAQKILKEASYDRALLELAKTEITTPFDGRVIEKNIMTGEYVRNSQYIGRIYKNGLFDIDINLPVKDMKWIMPLMEGKGKEPEVQVFFNNHETSSNFWIGKVSRIKSKIDERTRTMPVVVEMDDTLSNNGKNIYMRPGMFVNVLIKGERYHNVYVLPRYMVNFDDSIYLIKDERLISCKVNILRKFKDRIYVKSGITEKDLVIKTRIPEAVEGMLLRRAN